MAASTAGGTCCRLYRNWRCASSLDLKNRECGNTFIAGDVEDVKALPEKEPVAPSVSRQQQATARPGGALKSVPTLYLGDA